MKLKFVLFLRQKKDELNLMKNLLKLNKAMYFNFLVALQLIKHKLFTVN